MLRSMILDMDGVICDSEALHMQAFQEILNGVCGINASFELRSFEVYHSPAR